MHHDARNLENNSVIEGDICIVGAGTAGISTALAWLGSDKKVILLEGGGFEYDNDVQDLHAGTTSGQKYYPLKSTRLHYFGGQSDIGRACALPTTPLIFKKESGFLPVDGPSPVIT